MEKCFGEDIRNFFFNYLSWDFKTSVLSFLAVKLTLFRVIISVTIIQEPTTLT